jgi:hypothetical protein
LYATVYRANRGATDEASPVQSGVKVCRGVKGLQAQEANADTMGRPAVTAKTGEWVRLDRRVIRAKLQRRPPSWSVRKAIRASPGLQDRKVNRFKVRLGLLV